MIWPMGDTSNNPLTLHGLIMIWYLYDATYSGQVKRQCKPVENDGLVDSVKQIIVNGFYNPYMLNLLLSPF